MNEEPYLYSVYEPEEYDENNQVSCRHYRTEPSCLALRPEPSIETIDLSLHPIRFFKLIYNKCKQKIVEFFLV